MGIAPAQSNDAAFVYWTAGELLRAVIPFLAEGLRSGEKVVYVAHDLPAAVIEGALAAEGIDVSRERSSGRLAVLSAEEAFFAGGRFDVEAALRGFAERSASAAVEGCPRVRFAVEMTYLLAGVPGLERVPEFEARLAAEVFAQFPYTSICSFNGAREVTPPMAAVLAAHPVLLAGGIPLPNPYYDAATPARAG